MSCARRIRERTLWSDNSLRPSSSSATNRWRRYPRENVVHVSQSHDSSSGRGSSRCSALRMLTGPWRFVSWEHDDYLRFAANSTYWGGAPLADSLTVRIVPEALTRAAEFLSGRLSVVEVPFGETVKWQQDHADGLKRKPALRPIYV